MIAKLITASACTEIQTVSHRIAACQCIGRSLHRRIRISVAGQNRVKPSCHCRSELSRLIDHICDRIRKGAAPDTIHHNCPDCDLSLVRLVARFAEDQRRKKLLL